MEVGRNLLASESVSISKRTVPDGSPPEEEV